MPAAPPPPQPMVQGMLVGDAGAANGAAGGNGEDGPPPGPYAIALTAGGKILRFSLTAVAPISNKKGRVVVRLDQGFDGDKVVGVEVSDGTENVCLATQTARVLIFHVNEANIVSGAAKGVTAPGYTPPGAVWADPGDFFEEAAEYFDPVQGALGDCYFIAALSAVAWSRPYVIMQRSRATGAAAASFVDRIDFYSGGLKTMEVSERVPLVTSTNAWIYARSSEAGEIWPAVYEKAFAKWKTNDATDEPNYGPIAGGWPVQATTELTNLTGVTKTCSALSEDDIWTAVRSNCLSYRTFNPMTAWTFCQTPSPVEYSGTGIVGYHAYTILGWAYVNNTKYIVLRNPWGHNSPVINSLPGNWSAYDTSFWRSVPLNAGGVFAIPAGTFKKYYWQFGWAS